MRADGHAEAAQLVEQREIEAGKSAEEEVEAVEGLAIRSDVVGRGEEDRRRQGRHERRDPALKCHDAEHRSQRKKEEQAKENLFVNPGADKRHDATQGLVLAAADAEANAQVAEQRAELAAQGPQAEGED